MKSILLGTYTAAILCFLAFFETASSTTNFYRPGHGVLLDWWLTNHTWNYYNNSYLDKLTNENKDFKKCPLFAANADSFEHTFTEKGRLQYGRYRAYFIAPQTGNYKFFAIFNSKCEVYITTPPTGQWRVIASNSATGDDWNKRVWTVSLELVQGFRYHIGVLHYAYGDKKAFFRLGVRLPDKTEVKPISKNFLWRSMAFYKWPGVLVEKTNSIKFPSWELYSVSRIYDMNADADITSSYHCKSGLYDKSTNQFFGNNYSLQYSGYIKPTYSRRYTFTMNCDELCSFEIINNHDGNKKMEFVIRNYTNPGSVNVQSYLRSTEFYPITAFLAEANNGGYMRVINDGNYDPLLLNLKTDETSSTIPSPVTKVINQTYIKVTLKTPPSLPPIENWTYLPKYDLFYRQDRSENYIKFVLNGSLPISVNITGLRNYTKYLFHARYYGYANNSTTLNMISAVKSATTDEDVPGKPPTSISGQSASSTSIKITWGAVPSDFQYGIIRQYNVYFKQSSKVTWEKQEATASQTHHTITDLQYWTYYDVKISASTTAGEGSVSNAVTVRTAEHFPTAAPPFFGAYDVTDATIVLKWNEIPTEYRHGIITGYSIKFKKKGTQIWKETTISKGKTTWTVDTLIRSTKYELKIAGETAVGIGSYSDVIVVKTEVGLLTEVKPTTYFTSLDFTDKVLTKHISKTTQVTAIEQCFRACLDCIKPNSGCSCSSFNIKRPSSSLTSFTCEINASDHDACPLDFIKESGYQYYQIL